MKQRTFSPLLMKSILTLTLAISFIIVSFSIYMQLQLKATYESQVRSALATRKDGLESLLSTKEQHLRSFLLFLRDENEVIDVVTSSVDSDDAPGEYEFRDLALSRDMVVRFLAIYSSDLELLYHEGNSTSLEQLQLQQLLPGNREEVVHKILLGNDGIAIASSTMISSLGMPLGYIVVEYGIDRDLFSLLKGGLDLHYSLAEVGGDTEGSIEVGYTTRVDEQGRQLTGLTIEPQRDLLLGNHDSMWWREIQRGDETYFIHEFFLTSPRSRDVLVQLAFPSEALAPPDAREFYLILAVVLIVIMVVTAVVATRVLIGPILALSTGVESLRRHLKVEEPFQPIFIPSNDEIGRLAKAFNSLGSELMSRIEQIHGQRREILSYAQDLEDRVRERTRELESARLRAEMANIQKSRFLVNMNHEFRTPLNSIKGITDLLRFGAYDHNEDLAEIVTHLSQQVRGSSAIDHAEMLHIVADELEADSNASAVVMRVIKKLLENEASEDPDHQARIKELIAKGEEIIEQEEVAINTAYGSIQDAGMSLLNIIDEVINLSRIESGVIELNYVPTDLDNLLASCLVHGENYARTKNKHQLLHFTTEVDPKIKEPILLDHQKIKQVILNLLTNAIKYTPSGSVDVRVLHEGDMVRFEVSDSGIGIAEKDRDLIFMEFGRTFAVREIEGTGLGLALSKKIVELHEGEMDFISTENKGSTFWFRLPIRSGVPAESDGDELLLTPDK